MYKCTCKYTDLLFLASACVHENENRVCAGSYRHSLHCYPAFSKNICRVSWDSSVNESKLYAFGIWIQQFKASSVEITTAYCLVCETPLNTKFKVLFTVEGSSLHYYKSQGTSYRSTQYMHVYTIESNCRWYFWTIFNDYLINFN